MNFRQQPQTKPGNDTAYQNVEKYQRIMKPRFRQSQNPKFIFVRFKIVKNISTAFAVYLFQQGLTNGQKLSQIITFHTLIVCFLRN